MYDNSTIVFNQSNITNDSLQELQNVAATKSPFCLTYDYFYHVINAIILFIGIVGNIITVKLMWGDRNRSPTSFLLIVLAVCDFLVCFCLFWITTLLRIFKRADVSRKALTLTVTYWQVLINPIFSTCSLATSWVVLQVAIHRYIVVCLPLKATTYGTIKVARYQAIFAIAFSIIFNIPKWFENQFLYRNGDVVFYTFREAYENDIYGIFYKVGLYYFVIFIIPITILVVITYKLIKAIRVANKKREQMTQKSKEKNEITVSLITVVVIYVLCQCINPIRRLASYYVSRDEESCPNPYYFLNGLSGIAILVNSSANFVVYIICAKRFRERLRTMCFPFRITRVHPLQGNAFTVTAGTEEAPEGTL